MKNEFENKYIEKKIEKVEKKIEGSKIVFSWLNLNEGRICSKRSNSSLSNVNP